MTTSTIWWVPPKFRDRVALRPSPSPTTEENTVGRFTGSTEEFSDGRRRQRTSGSQPFSHHTAKYHDHPHRRKCQTAQQAVLRSLQ